MLGVTGGIAAYKAAELVRLLRGAGAEVRVVMTRAATAFVAPLTFQALSGHPVALDELDRADVSGMDHIALARWADIVLVAPATADFMARHGAGMADDLLSTLCLATTAPVMLAPAMNRAMWEHPATRSNVTTLLGRGVRLLGPDEGAQACGDVGPGRMLEPVAILSTLEMTGQGGLSGVTVLMTAGPTREAIDPVRYITNRSSGRMGYALAEAATEAGADVILVSGPTVLPVPRVRELVRVESASEMYQAVMARIAGVGLFIGTAAVADYAPDAEMLKIKKGAEGLILSLQKTRDILAEVSALKKRPFTVGFAAETHDVEQYARQKLESKRLDMIAANRVGDGLGFDVDDNALYVCWQGGETCLSLAPKPRIARQLITLITERLNAQDTAESTG